MCLHLWVMLNTEERAGKWFRSSGYSTGNKITSKAGQMPMSRGRVRVGGDTDERQVIAYHGHEETSAGSHWPQGSRGFLVWFCDYSVGESQSGDCVVLLCSSWDGDCWDRNDAGGDTQQSNSRDSFRQFYCGRATIKEAVVATWRLWTVKRCELSYHQQLKKR